MIKLKYLQVSRYLKGRFAWRNLDLPFLSCLKHRSTRVEESHLGFTGSRWTCSHPWTHGICHDQADVDHHRVPCPNHRNHMMSHNVEYENINMLCKYTMFYHDAIGIIGTCTINHPPKFVGSNPFLWCLGANFTDTIAAKLCDVGGILHKWPDISGCSSSCSELRWVVWYILMFTTCSWSLMSHKKNSSGIIFLAHGVCSW